MVEHEMASSAGVLALAGTVLAASLLGSAHCAGMCGGIALVACGEDRGTRLLRQAGYHGGRLASYAVLGAVAGLVGSAVDDLGVLAGVQRVAAIAAGATIAVFGVVAILRGFGWRVPSAGVPAPLVRMAQSVHARTLRLPPAWRGVPLGLATPLLPCGWLYAFAAIAAGSGSIAVGALVLAAFWLGTLPALVVATAGARFVVARFGRAAPVLMGVAMCAVGVHVAASRAGLADIALRDARATAGSTRVSLGALSDEVARIEDEVPPCCRKQP
jgi:hypothetical protein